MDGGKNVRVILIDDEQLALSYLEYQLTSIGNINIIGKYTDTSQAKEVIENNQVDVVFLDIQMPEVNGLEFAELLLENQPSLNIVFITAYQEYAIKAFELNALDYILKPVNSKRLLKTISRIQGQEEFKYLEGKLEKDKFLYLNLLGKINLSSHDGETIPLKWRTGKAEQLFHYLIHSRETPLDKSVLVDLFWEDFEYKNAQQQLYATIYQIRKTLKGLGEYFIIKSNMNGYQLIFNRVKLDTEEVEKVFNNEVRQDNIKEFERAVEKGRGDYLPGCDFDWCLMERQRLSILWLQAYFRLIEWYSTRGKLEKVINHSLNILSYHPYEERAYFYLMKAFAKQGDHMLVYKYYSELYRTIEKDLNVKPSKEIIEWYNNWQIGK